MIVTTSIRVPEDQMARWKDTYWATISQHQLSWNRYIILAIEEFNERIAAPEEA